MHDVHRRMRLGLAALRRAGERIDEHVRTAPGTYTYFFALLVTTFSVRGLAPEVADRLVRFQSTNLDNLSDRPVQVLLLSAFWTTGAGAFGLLVRFALVLAPVERRLGTRRWLLVFATAHVAATLLTVAGISFAIGHGMTDPGLAEVVDVGVSYGLYGVAGTLTWLLTTSRARVVWVALALLSVLVVSFAEPGFTDVGHLLSLAIGLAFRPLVRRWQRNPVPRAALGGRPIAVPRLAWPATWTRSAARWRPSGARPPAPATGRAADDRSASDRVVG
jgi:hypothetical protein